MPADLLLPHFQDGKIVENDGAQVSIDTKREAGMETEEKIFRKKSLFARCRMSQAELDKYYEAYRKDRYEKGKGTGSLWWRKLIHPILILGIKVERIFHRESLKIIHDRRIKNSRPKIFACTHVGGHDAQRSFEGVGEHAFVFVGDPRELYRNFDGALLFLNGMICLETRSIPDRKIAKENAVELLRKGGNLLIYPEGAWNLSENLLVDTIYMGTASMALKTGADIIPVALEEYDKKFYMNIGENIDSRKWNPEQIPQLTEHLRNRLAELKWEILEQNGVQRRDTVAKEFKDNWVESIFAKTDYSYSAQDVYETRCRSREEIEQEEAHAYIDRLIPSKNNAFLFRRLVYNKG